MKRFKTLAFVCLLILNAHLANGQSMAITSNNGTTSTLDISSIRSIVFENNNLVFNTTDCGDNYFNIFFCKNLNFETSSTAIEEVNTASNSISIYPNPATNSITISKSTSESTDGYIYNITGKTMMKLNLTNQSNTIDISTLPSGLYFVLLDNQSTKFIKR
jgi:Neuraminidase (sialidase)